MSLLMAASQVESTSWDAATIAALVVAIGGLITAIFTGTRSLRSDRFRREVESGSALLSGYTDMVSQLRVELDRVKEDNQEERNAWRAEREALRVEFDDSRLRTRAQHATEVHDLNVRITDLSEQVYALQHRPQSARTRQTDS